MSDVLAPSGAAQQITPAGLEVDCSIRCQHCQSGIRIRDSFVRKVIDCEIRMFNAPVEEVGGIGSISDSGFVIRLVREIDGGYVPHARSVDSAELIEIVQDFPLTQFGRKILHEDRAWMTSPILIIGVALNANREWRCSRFA